MIDDLRLIFSNALRYNARLRGTDTVSGRAYEAALYMSAKLEAAVNKLLLSVADRLERERIDHANAEREIEAAERAEEEAIRAVWKKEPEKDGDSSKLPERSTALQQKIRQARRAQRREAADFEIPFFDEDEGSGEHERSYFEVVKFQKSRFEKQRQEFSKMRQSTRELGAAIYQRMSQHNDALDWSQKQQAIKTAMSESTKTGNNVDKEKGDANEKPRDGPSNVLKELEREGREPIVKMKLGPLTKKTKTKKTKKRKLLTDF